MSSLLIKAGWIVPGDESPIPQGAILIRDGRIADIGHWHEFDAISGGVDEIIDEPTSWVFPGFINTHHHNNSSFGLGFKDENGELGLFRVFSQNGFAEPEKAIAYQYLSTKLLGCQLLLNGVTTTIDMAWGGKYNGLPHDAGIQAYRDLGLRGVYAPIACSELPCKAG